MEEPGFKEELLEYLHLEYGETPGKPDSLKLSDLKFLGQFLLEGNPTYYWSYPQTIEKAWAVVFFMDDLVCFDMTTTPPTGLKEISEGEE